MVTDRTPGVLIGIDSPQGTFVSASGVATTIEVVSTRQPNAITPGPVFQALAMALFGATTDFGLTPAQALKPNV